MANKLADDDNVPVAAGAPACADAANRRPISFISMFSGIEAASVAFGPLGWKAVCVAEIEKFPSAVLAHHYPDVPNVGDMTKHDWSQYHGKVDVVCGGPPCQAFSVAGLRNSMDDARGNLSIIYMRALHAIKPRNAIIENVPGWLSTKDNAFGCFLAGLVGADDALCPPVRNKWPNAGMVSGPKGRAAWCILDAQHFGLAQRRKRVIVVADFGNGADPVSVLFERKSLSGYSPASREAREGVAGGTGKGTKGGGGLGTDFDLDGGVIEAAVFSLQGNMIGRHDEAGPDGSGYHRDVSFTLTKTDIHAVAYAPEIARCDATREGSSQDYESTTMAVSVNGTIAHTLASEPSDASEDGTGRGTPIIAFSAKDYGADASNDISPTLRAGGHTNSHANAGVMPAIAFNARQHPTTGPISDPLGAQDTGHGVMVRSSVRRLTPMECERLQGFRDDYTRIPMRHYKARKITRTRPADMWDADPNGGWWLMAADGPRYKSLGNSWAVPKFRWIGERVQRFMPAASAGSVANDNHPTDREVPHAAAA